MINRNVFELRQPSETVIEINDEIRAFVQTMVKSLVQSRGVGLSAPQLGVHKRIILARIPGQKYISCFINPKIIKREGLRYIKEECLSVPGQKVVVKRASKIEAVAYNITGNPVKIKAKRLLAQIMEHEIDHLDGILCIDKALYSRVNGTG